MIYIGIDPGKEGAVAVLSDDSKTPNIKPLAEIGHIAFVYQREAVALIEKQIFVKKQSAQGLMTRFREYGRILGILEAHGIKPVEIEPRTWKSALGLTGDRAAKEYSIQKAKALFPGIVLRWTDKCRVDNHNMAEAALLAWLCRGMRK